MAVKPVTLHACQTWLSYLSGYVLYSTKRRRWSTPNAQPATHCPTPSRSPSQAIDNEVDGRPDYNKLQWSDEYEYYGPQSMEEFRAMKALEELIDQPNATDVAANETKLFDLLFKKVGTYQRVIRMRDLYFAMRYPPK